MLTGNANQYAYNCNKGRSKNSEVLVAAVERSIAGFVEQTLSIINTNPPEVVGSLIVALDDVKKSGKFGVCTNRNETDDILGVNMLSASIDFIKDTCSSQKRATMVIAARVLLQDIARLLIIADRIDIGIFLSAIKKVHNN